MCAGFPGWAAPKVNNALSQRATRNMNTNGIRVPDSGNPMEPKNALRIAINSGRALSKKVTRMHGFYVEVQQ